MTPQTDQLVWISEVGRRNQFYAMNDFGVIAEVKHVVAFGRSGQEGAEHALVEIQCCFDHRMSQLNDGSLKRVFLKVPIDLPKDIPKSMCWFIPML